MNQEGKSQSAEGRAVAAVEEQTKMWEPLDLLDELTEFAASQTPDEHVLTHARIRTAHSRIHEALSSCPPAPPPSVSPAEETSSGGELPNIGATAGEWSKWVRGSGKGSTAAGAGSCCEPRRLFIEVFGSLRHTGERVEGIGPFTHCPWCGTKLDKEA